MSYASIEEAMIHGWEIERSFICHAHDDHEASASVNSVSGLWFCYACGARGKYNVRDVPMDKLSAALTKYLERSAEPRIYSESYLDVYDATGPGRYWLSRFSEQTCRDFRLGHDSTNRFATIPFRNNRGEVLGIIRRDLTGQDEAKYRYPSGANVSRYLFNYHQAEGDILLLTEGATDAIAAVEAGFPDAVASYRNGLSRIQRQEVVRYDPSVLLVAYDQDDAGERGFQQVQEALSGAVRVDRLYWSDYKDLASIPLDERREMLKTLR